MVSQNHMSALDNSNHVNVCESFDFNRFKNIKNDSDEYFELLLQMQTLYHNQKDIEWAFCQSCDVCLLNLPCYEFDDKIIALEGKVLNEITIDPIWGDSKINVSQNEIRFVLNKSNNLLAENHHVLGHPIIPIDFI
jgi:hypothetical protein